MLNVVERIKSVLTFYSPVEVIQVINLLAESRFVTLSSNRSNVSGRSGLHSLFSALGYNTKTISIDQSTALNEEAFDAAHTFLTVVGAV